MSSNGAAGKAILAKQWLSKYGTWDLSNPQAPSFAGKSSISGKSNGRDFALGLAVSDLMWVEGELKAVVALRSTEDISSAALVFGFESDEQPYFTAQIGGANEAYSVGESVPHYGFRPILSGGQPSDITSSEPHTLHLVLEGMRFKFFVDGVLAVKGILPRPLAGRQIGLLASGSARVDFSQITTEGHQGSAFVVMKFKQEYFNIYEQSIKNVIEAEHLRPVQANELYGPRLIINDIRQEIERSRVVVAEISAPDRNENVFFEVGYALALRKPTILVAQRGRELPFDINGFRVVYYDDTIAGKSRFEEDLKLNLKAALSEAA